MRAADLTIGARLAAAFAPIILLLLAGTAVGLGRLTALNDDFRAIVAERHGRAELVHAVIREDNELLRAVQQLAFGDGAAREADRAGAARARLSQLLERLDAAFAQEDGEARQLQQAAHDRHSRYLVSLTRFLRLAASGRHEEARTHLRANLLPQLDASLQAMHALGALQTRRIAASVDRAGEAYRAARNAMLAVALASCLLAVVIGYLAARGIVRPLGLAVEVAQRVAAGNLAGGIAAGGRSETGRLVSALKAMNDGLAAIVVGVREGSEAVARAARDLVGANEGLSARTEKHAAALEETAATMEQFAASAAQNAANAKRASDVARAAATCAARGHQAVDRVAANARSIHAACAAIAQVVSAVDRIALQTNIVALNAAVEAAHGGDGARGFAAVASEVRGLAMRSAAAAAEVKALAAEAVAAAQEGSVLVGQAGGAMNDLLAAATTVAQIMAEISVASEEQRAGIAQASGTVSEMDAIAQQNAALVGQVSAAMEALEEGAGRLLAAVRVFELGDQDRLRARAASRDSPLPALPRLAK